MCKRDYAGKAAVLTFIQLRSTSEAGWNANGADSTKYDSSSSCQRAMATERDFLDWRVPAELECAARIEIILPASLPDQKQRICNEIYAVHSLQARV